MIYTQVYYLLTCNVEQIAINVKTSLSALNVRMATTFLHRQIVFFVQVYVRHVLTLLLATGVSITLI